MQIWPAIDIRDGNCVRLIQGDFARETADAEHSSGVVLPGFGCGTTVLPIHDRRFPGRALGKSPLALQDTLAAARDVSAARARGSPA